MEPLSFQNIDRYLSRLAYGEAYPVIELLLGGVFSLLAVWFVMVALMRIGQSVQSSGPQNIQEKANLNRGVISALLAAAIFGSAPSFLDLMTHSLGVNERGFMSYSNAGSTTTNVSNTFTSLFIFSLLLGWIAIMRGVLMADRTARNAGANDSFGAAAGMIIGGVLLANLEGLLGILRNTFF